MNPIIHLKNVSFRYGDLTDQPATGREFDAGEPAGDIVQDLTLEIMPGECVLITGASGCGKTTLTRLINGLIPHYYEGRLSGEIFIKGQTYRDISAWGYGLDVGSVFQDARSQFFTSHVLDELAFSAENYGKDPMWIQERIRQIVSANRIDGLCDRNLNILSSGEKQKIAMAAVQINDPDIYVLDEPSANLDELSCLRLAEYLKELKKSGKTIVLADHRLYYLMDIADRVVYMRHGTIHSEWAREPFMQLTDKQLKGLGLRVTRINHLSEVGSPCRRCQAEDVYLKIRKLSVAAQRFQSPLFEGFDLIAKRGEIIAITGENGVGKTTFAKTLCGLLPERSGDIRINSQLIRPKDRIKKLWFVLQDTDYQLFSDSVINELVIGFKKDETQLRRAETLLKDLDLWAYKDQHPATLSGGQKQRLTFAVGLMRDPEILILDEPTSGLDGLNMNRITQLIKEQSKKGTLIFVISHDNEFVSQCCDRIVQLERPLADGTRQAVVTP